MNAVSYDRKSFRVLSFLVALTVLMSCFSFLGGYKVSAENDSAIKTFEMTLTGGAARQDEGYVWKANQTASGHQFVYRIKYAFWGEGMLDRDNVQITIPRHILKSRNGRYADRCELAIPEEIAAVGGNEFYYTESGDHIILKNDVALSAADEGYIEIAYTTTQSTYSYRDMQFSDVPYASITLSGGGSGSARVEAPAVAIDTSAEIASTEIKEPDERIESWNDEWGAKPDDADEYYYLEWLVSSMVSATQPYYIRINGFCDDHDNSLVGYKMQGEDEYTRNNTSALSTQNFELRYDYILTRHKKSAYGMEQYKITERLKTTVIPSDRVDAPTTAENQAIFKYDRPIFVYPTENYNAWKYGTTSWEERFDYKWPAADYRLREFIDGEINEISGDLKYAIYTIAEPYYATLAPGGSSSDPSAYGKSNVNFFVTDETFYLNDEITTDHEEITIPEGTEPLGPDDYQIDHINFYIYIRDAVFSQGRQRFIDVAGTYQDDEIVYFDGKFGSSGTWVEDIAHINMKTGESYVDPEYAKSITNKRVELCDGCIGYRFRLSNAHWSTITYIYPYCVLKRTDSVLDTIINGPVGEDTAWMTNIADFRVTDYRGRTHFSKVINGRDYMYGFVKNSFINKSLANFENDKTNKKAYLRWQINVNESFMTNAGEQRIIQDSGTIYDLLPIGADCDLSSVSVISWNKELPASAYDVDAVVNYNGTGRTLLRVHIKEQFSDLVMRYTMVYTWDSVKDYGGDVLNSVAFETGNEEIAGGCPDDGGEILESELMKELDPDSDGSRFIYAQSAYVVDILTAVNSGLSKNVKNTKDYEYDDSTIVRQNGLYMYRLRYSTNQGYGTKDMIFFDSLENFSDSTRRSEWKGTLEQVDTSQMSKAGAAPAVYYSSAEALDINLHHDLDETVDGERLWKTEEEFGDISGAKAIAIDLRKDKDGNDFILPTDESVVAILYMRAPAGDTSGSRDPMTYNSVFLSDSMLDDFGNEEEYFIRHECTAVNFRIMADINILKVNSEDKTTPVKNVVFRLYGESLYGTVTDTALATDINGRLVFRDIEKGEYTLTETEGSDDYLPIKRPMRVVIDDYGAVTIDGTPVSEGVFYNLEDQPRIHTDIGFYKTDLVDDNRFIKNASFELSGVSEYNNEILMRAVSDENGLVTFKNVEMGTYELTEIRAVDGYILNRNVYDVTVTSSGLFSITVNESKGAGDTDLLKRTERGLLTICNEPYHGFTLQKEAFSSGNAIKDAEFELIGENGYGTVTDIIKSTNERGQIVFSGLESGVYTLTETKVPYGYALDDTVRTVTIDKYGNVVISDSEQDAEGRFVIINKENGSITITKKWVDNETNLTRTAEPVIHLSTDLDMEHSAYFSNVGGNTVLSKVTPVNNITSFAQSDLEDSEVQRLIDNGTAVKIDDGKTDCSIYAWKTADGGILWWSNAKNVYLTDGARWLWRGLPNCVSIDFSGINASKLTSAYYMFQGDTKLADLDVRKLDTSSVTDMSNMFMDCSALRNVTFGGRFKTDKVSSFANMFIRCSSLTVADLRSFDTPELVNMESMFAGCKNLEYVYLTSFTTEKLTSMTSVFYTCEKLREIDLRSFDTSNVKYMANLFYDCVSVTDILVSEKFVTDNVTNMYSMFSITTMDSLYASEEHPDRIDVRTFVTSKCTNMVGMFGNCSNIEELDLKNFDTAKVTDMTQMFAGCSKLRVLDVSSFDTSKVTSMTSMFYNCKSLSSLDLRSFDTHNNQSFSSTFYYCSELTEVLVSGRFVTDNALYGNNMFVGCSKLVTLYADSDHPDNIDVRTFNTSKMTTVAGMFCGCSKIKELDLRNFDTSNVTDFAQLFDGCVELEVLDVSGFDTSKATSLGFMFSNIKKIEQLDIRNFNTRNVEQMYGVFQNCSKLQKILVGEDFVTGKVVSMSGMFNGCTSITSLYADEENPYQIDVRTFDTRNVTNFSNMFNGCSKLTELDLRNFDTSKATDMSIMFSGCNGLASLNVSSFDTSLVTNLYYMFNGCTNLTVLDLRSFDTPNVTNMAAMFSGNTALKYIYVSDGFVTTNVQSFINMFARCQSIESLDPDGSVPDLLDLRKFNTVNVTNMNSMFQACNKLRNLDLTSFDTSSVTNTDNMFAYCDLLETITVSDLWNMGKVTSSINMFLNDRNLVGGNDTTYNAAIVNATYARIDRDNEHGYLTGGSVTVSSADKATFKKMTLTSMFSAGSVKAFKHYTGSDAESIISSGNVKRADDCSTVHKIYLWLESSTGTLYWWSDTENVYLNNCSSQFWKNLNACQSISLSGIDTTKLHTAAGMFLGCSSLISIDLSPMDTHSISNMSEMFSNCTSLKTISFGPDFDTSKVINMSNMFSGCKALEQLDLSVFDTSSANNIYRMFNGCSSLTGITFGADFKAEKAASLAELFNNCSQLTSLDLSGFRPAENKTMYRMLYGCSSLQSVDFEGFITSNCTSMTEMFSGCTNLSSLDLSSFDTRKVVYMGSMFRDCKALTALSLDSFETPALTNMSYMFYSCQNLVSLTMSSFDTSKVTSFSFAFCYCSKLRSLDLSNFNNISASDFSNMFRECQALETLTLSDTFVCSAANYLNMMFYNCKALQQLDVSHFDTRNVTSMNNMFALCEKVEALEVGGFITSKVTNMGNMFVCCYKITSLSLENFDTSNVTLMNSMFNGCILLERLDLRSFDTHKVTDFSNMFRDCKVLNELKLPEQFVTEKAVDIQFLFCNCHKLPSIETSKMDTRNVTNYASVFSGCHAITEIDVSSLDTSKGVNFSSMFANCFSLEEIDVSNLITSNATDMGGMFSGCNKLKKLDISNFDAYNVKNYSYMFYYCNMLEELILPEKFVSEKAQDISSMFNACQSLKSLDLSGFDTRNVTNMKFMFTSCRKLEELDLSGLNTYKVTSGEAMFNSCNSLKSLDLSSMYTGRMTDMSNMFRYCNELTELDLRNFDTSKVTNMPGMFGDDPKLERIYVSELWSTDKVTNSTDMFVNSRKIKGENGTAFNASIVDKNYAVVDNDEHKGYLSYRAPSVNNGNSFVSTDEGCIIEKVDDTTWTYTFTGLNPSLVYHAWEDELENYISSNLIDNSLEVKELKGTITNTTTLEPPPVQQYGSLKITKRLSASEGTELTDEDMSRSFSFIITITDSSGNKLNGTALYGTTAFSGGVARVRIKADESLMLTDIPEGYNYSVAELPADGFIADVSVKSGVIEKDETAQVTFTNVKDPEPESFVSVTLKKQVNGIFENAGTYSFTILLSGLHREEDYLFSDGTGFRSDADGSARVTLTLGADEEITLLNIPAGAVYSISEDAGDYISSYQITNAADTGSIARSNGANSVKNKLLSTASETADKDEEITVTFTNILDKRQDLVLKKKIANATQSNSDRFSFTVKLTGLSANEQINIEKLGRKTADEKGRLTLTFELSGGESITFYQLPAGACYRIVEGVSDYVASYSIVDENGGDSIVSASGANDEAREKLSTETETVNEGEAAVVTFTNTKLQHDVTLTKLVDMTDGNLRYGEYSRQEFTFTVSLDGLEASKKYTVEYSSQLYTGLTTEKRFTSKSDGTLELSIVLKHGESAKLKDLPADAHYTVTEAAARFYISGFEITGNDGAVIAQSSGQNRSTLKELSTASETVDLNDLDVVLTYTNRYSASDYELPSAGREDMRFFLLLSFAGMLLFAAVFMAIRAKNSKAVRRK